MPTLNKYKNKDGYYIKGYLPGKGQNSTLQVTAEGLRRIHAAIGKQEGSFSYALLRSLIEQQLVYTQGLYPLEVVPRVIITRADPLLGVRSAARLVFVEGDQSWQLFLHIPEIPRLWIEQSIDLTSDLSNWSIHSFGVEPISAIALWPRKGGALIEVAPQQNPYRLMINGHYPPIWEVLDWLRPVSGLAPGATLFNYEGGERLESGASLDLGETYTMIAPANAAGHGLWPPPKILNPERVWQWGSWEAWIIQIPCSSSEQVRSWSEAAGYQLAAPRFKLTLVTPPQAYNDTGLPIVTVGENVSLCLSPVRTETQTDSNILFYKVRFQEAGIYRVAPSNTSAAALHMVAAKLPTKADLGRPTELLLRIAWDGQSIELGGLREGSDSLEICLPARSAQNLTVSVACPVPVNLSFESGLAIERHDSLAADEAKAKILDQLQEAGRYRIVVRLDAGAYGRISLVVSALSAAAPALQPLSPVAVRRARWLAASLLNHLQSGRKVLLPSQSRHILARFAAIPGCESLANIRYICASMMPHVHAITRLIQSH